jgi:predicted alpha/beta-fold hydrolase
VSLTCAPFDVNYVITNMNKAYQRYFLKYYIEKLVLQHDEMEFWYRCGLVDKAHLAKATTLRQFHERITEKIVGDPIDHIFDSLRITDSHIQNLQIPSLVIQARDDPMVAFDSIPIEALKANRQVKLIVTEKGGHMCWFEGIPPTRWYPRAIFQFIDDVRGGKKVSELE